MNRTLKDEVKAMIKDANLSRNYWEYALNQVATLHYWTGSGALNIITLYDSLLGSIPDNSSLRFFGCSPYKRLNKQVSSLNLADHARGETYLGSVMGMSRFYLLNSKRVVHSELVFFNGKTFPIEAPIGPHVLKYKGTRDKIIIRMTWQ